LRALIDRALISPARADRLSASASEVERREVEIAPTGAEERRRPAPAQVSVDQMRADGTATQWGFSADYDGKDNPMTGNNPDADMIARTRVDANTIQSISKKDGKVTTTQLSKVSADGKTRTVTTKGMNAAGKKVDNVAVYDKQ
jgi:hypothetical protein